VAVKNNKLVLEKISKKTPALKARVYFKSGR
jgi:hypothetical protein